VSSGAYFTTAGGYAQRWVIPDGVTAATFNMIGARGGGARGGRGGNFRATLDGLGEVDRHQLLACLGGSPRGPVGGANGGGPGAYGFFRTTGNGGGGATDVRISDRVSDCSENSDKRLLVAGGGGGAGGDASLSCLYLGWEWAYGVGCDASAVGGAGGSAGSSAATNGTPHRAPQQCCDRHRRRCRCERHTVGWGRGSGWDVGLPGDGRRRSPRLGRRRRRVGDRQCYRWCCGPCAFHRGQGLYGQ
jgi:hypothetical protein